MNFIPTFYPKVKYLIIFARLLRRQNSTHLFPLALPFREGRSSLRGGFLLRGGFKKPAVTSAISRAMQDSPLETA